ncbi:DNA helicase PIF1, ATP-dependent [Tanacetum coccineum]
MSATKSVVERKQDTSDKVSEAKSELFLDQLRLDVTGIIIVMVGRMWDVSVVNGRYLSMDFIVSDAKAQGILTSSLLTTDKVFLSSTSSTVIYDDVAILAIKALKKANSVVEQQTSGTPVDLSQPQAGTLENLLMWACNRKNNDKEGMELPFMWERHLTVGLQKCYRYRLEVDVSDDTAQAVVVMFNETTTDLVKCSADSLMDTTDESAEDHLSLPPALSNLIGTAHVMEIKSHTYYKYGTFESFMCWQIHPSEGIEDSVGSSTLDAVPDNHPHKLKRIARDPSIATPSKPAEERKNQDSGDLANGIGKKEALQPSDKKRKNRVEFDDSDADVSYGLGRVGAKGMDATHSLMEKRKRCTHIPFCLGN